MLSFFDASACFSLLYIIIVSVFRFCSVDLVVLAGFFMRVYVARVSFVYAVRVFGVLLPIFRFCWLFLVLQRITLGFDSMGDCLYGFWTHFLQVVVFVCELVDMYFLRRCCVFFSHSLLFMVAFVFSNVIEMAAVRESCWLLFSILTLS